MNGTSAIQSYIHAISTHHLLKQLQNGFAYASPPRSGGDTQRFAKAAHLCSTAGKPIYGSSPAGNDGDAAADASHGSGAADASHGSSSTRRRSGAHGPRGAPAPSSFLSSLPLSNIPQPDRLVTRPTDELRWIRRVEPDATDPSASIVSNVSFAGNFFTPLPR